jgi:hypothetical protein
VGRPTGARFVFLGDVSVAVRGDLDATRTLVPVITHDDPAQRLAAALCAIGPAYEPVRSALTPVSHTHVIQSHHTQEKGI